MTILPVNFRQPLSSTKVNELIDAINANTTALANFEAAPVATLRQSVAQSPSPATGVWTDIVMDTEDLDTAGGHSTITNPARYTATVAGLYLVAGSVAWAPNATGDRGARIALNGATLTASAQLVAANATALHSTTVAAVPKLVRLNGTSDFVTVQGWQASGAALATTVAGGDQISGMTVLWVAP